jgi:hypothetical protein
MHPPETVIAMTALEASEGMASLIAIPRSKSERFGLGAHGVASPLILWLPARHRHLASLTRQRRSLTGGFGLVSKALFGY